MLRAHVTRSDQMSWSSDWVHVIHSKFKTNNAYVDIICKNTVSQTYLKDHLY